MRHFGVTSRERLGGNSAPGSLQGIHNAPLLPAESLIDPGRPALERGYVAQAAIDVIAVGFALLFLLSVAAAFGLSFYWLFFVRY